MKIRASKGFTIIELLVVISIVGLLSSVVLASLASAREQARVASTLEMESHNYQKIGVSATGIYNFNPSGPSSDSSGNNNNLTLTGSGATINSAVSVDSKSGSLQISDSESYASISLPQTNTLIAPAASGFTISAWTYKTAAMAFGNELIISMQDPNDDFLYNKNIYCNPASGGKFGINLYAETGGYVKLFTGTPICTDLNHWHQFVFTYNNTPGSYNFSTYIDGKLFDSQNNANPYTYTTVSQIAIGNNVTNPTQGFIGDIDKVAIYGDALTATEVSKQYAEELKLKPKLADK